MIIKNGNSNYTATCDNCGEVIKNIFVLDDKIYGSSCIVGILNTTLYAAAPVTRKPYWIRAMPPETAIEMIEEHQEREKAKC